MEKPWNNTKFLWAYGIPIIGSEKFYFGLAYVMSVLSNPGASLFVEKHHKCLVLWFKDDL